MPSLNISQADKPNLGWGHVIDKTMKNGIKAASLFILGAFNF